MDRLIFHVDVNSAYLSWEATRQVARGGLDPRTVPAAIGGARDKRTGVILAKSIPAKRFGVRTGEPVAMELRKCQELLLFPPDFGLYTRCSAAFAAICREYAPAVEQFSIDECFLDLTGTGAIYPDPVALAHTIRERIREELGFTVNIGIAPNKLLAKMASDFEKPDRVHTLFPDEIPAKMWPLPVGELFTVGAATAEKLNRMEIATIGDLARTDLGRLQRLLGQKFGLQLHRYANGLDDSPVRAEPEEAKGYSNSVTLEEDVRTRDEARQILLLLADSVTARMRRDKKRAGCVAVTVRDSDFKDHSHQRTLAAATDITAEVYATGRQLFDELWDGRPLRLLGISLTGLVGEGEEQLSLFTGGGRERQRQLDQTVDALRKKYGAAAIRPAASVHSTLTVGKKYQAQMEEEDGEARSHTAPPDPHR